MTIFLILIWIALTIRGAGLFARFQKNRLLFYKTASRYSEYAYRDSNRPREAHWGDFLMFLIASITIGFLIAGIHDVVNLTKRTFTSNALKSRPDQIIGLASGTAQPREERKAERIKQLEAENARLERELEL